MNILLLGEYSNVHHTLRDALRRQGHDVILISDGDGWKDYPRDYDLRRVHEGPVGSLFYVARLLQLLPKMKGYDVVQLINPDLLHLKPRWNRWLFDYLRHHNRCISVGCFGDDYYVISRSQSDYVEQRLKNSNTPYLEYTDFYAFGHRIEHPLNVQRMQGWVQSGKAQLTQYVMARADCLVACLYEYYKVYETPEFFDRLHYIPLPILRRSVQSRVEKVNVSASDRPLNVLLAVQKRRAAMKGTDQMEPLFQRLAAEHPDKIELHRIESVPFDEYCRLLDEADVIVDQLYSYTPAMNALEAMSRGKVVVSGGEEDYYRFQESKILPDSPQAKSPMDRHYQDNGHPLRPIINLRPFQNEENYRILCDLLLDSATVEQMKRDSKAFIDQYHDADYVAQQYLTLWRTIMDSK